MFDRINAISNAIFTSEFRSNVMEKLFKSINDIKFGQQTDSNHSMNICPRIILYPGHVGILNKDICSLLLSQCLFGFITATTINSTFVSTTKGCGVGHHTSKWDLRLCTKAGIKWIEQEQHVMDYAYNSKCLSSIRMNSKSIGFRMDEHHILKFQVLRRAFSYRCET